MKNSIACSFFAVMVITSCATFAVRNTERDIAQRWVLSKLVPCSVGITVASGVFVYQALKSSTVMSPQTQVALGLAYGLSAVLTTVTSIELDLAVSRLQVVLKDAQMSAGHPYKVAIAKLPLTRDSAVAQAGVGVGVVASTVGLTLALGKLAGQ